MSRGDSRIWRRLSRSRTKRNAPAVIFRDARPLTQYHLTCELPARPAPRCRENARFAAALPVASRIPLISGRRSVDRSSGRGPAAGFKQKPLAIGFHLGPPENYDRKGSSGVPRESGRAAGPWEPRRCSSSAVFDAAERYVRGKRGLVERTGLRRHP